MKPESMQFYKHISRVGYVHVDDWTCNVLISKVLLCDFVLNFSLYTNIFQNLQNIIDSISEYRIDSFSEYNKMVQYPKTKSENEIIAGIISRRSVKQLPVIK